jgi:hypothetical protein
MLFAHRSGQKLAVVGLHVHEYQRSGDTIFVVVILRQVVKIFHEVNELVREHEQHHGPEKLFNVLVHGHGRHNIIAALVIKLISSRREDEMASEDDPLFEPEWRENDHAVTADEVRDIIHENKELFGRSGLGQWIGIVIVVWLAINGFDEAWYSKWRYAMWHGTSSDKVTIDQKPHDCDFLASPLGEKNCRYDAQVQVQTIKLSTDTNSGRRIVSYDEGKTWGFNDGPNPATFGDSVYVGWQKVDE